MSESDESESEHEEEYDEEDEDSIHEGGGGLEDGDLEEGPLIDGSSDSEDEDVEELFQKLKSNADYIRDVHPEILGINHQEMEAMSHVIYNEHGIIDDPLHTGTPILTKYEHARVLGARAAQIDNGADPFIIVDSIMDGYTIAKEELKQKKIPFVIRRPMPNGKFEIWKLDSLENIY